MAAVSYVPSDQHASLFWEKHHKQGAYIESKVPDGFPEKLVSPLAWTRADIEKKQSDCVLELGKDDIEQIEAALASFEAQSLDLSQISPSTFTLSESLVTLFKQVSNQVYSGVGFNVIHGLDPGRYTPEQNVIIYAGIAAHVASQRGFLDRNAQRVLCWYTLSCVFYHTSDSRV
jgi:hypothetical protein